MRFKAVFFDLDGTLVDSFAAIAASVNHVRTQRGLEPWSVEEVTRFVGRGPEYLLTNTIPGGDLQEDLALYRAHHPGVMFSLTRLLSGAAETLTRLHAGSFKLGVCSNKPRVFSERLLEHLGLARLFQAVLGPEDVARLKPAPDMLQAALTRTVCKPEDALYVGDMTVDIQTARAAGVTVWAIATGTESADQLRAAGPDRLLERLDDVAISLTRD